MLEPLFLALFLALASMLGAVAFGYLLAALVPLGRLRAMLHEPLLQDHLARIMHLPPGQGPRSLLALVEDFVELREHVARHLQRPYETPSVDLVKALIEMRQAAEECASAKAEAAYLRTKAYPSPGGTSGEGT